MSLIRLMRIQLIVEKRLNMGRIFAKMPILTPINMTTHKLSIIFHVIHKHTHMCVTKSFIKN
jgi:hypothetical protein